MVMMMMLDFTTAGLPFASRKSLSARETWITWFLCLVYQICRCGLSVAEMLRFLLAKWHPS